VDENVKLQAEPILEDIGINVTTLFNSCLKALVRERRVPFSMEDGSRARLIREKLEESLAVAADPAAPRFTHDEIFAPLKEKYGYDV
jgi:DNA-damage-inducible protein J